MFSQDSIVKSTQWQSLQASGQHFEDCSNIDTLDEHHAAIFRSALSNVLSTPVAEHAFAQIVDGLPTEESFTEFNGWKEGHPVFELNHTELCDGVIEKTRDFRSNFDPSSLTFKRQLLSAFQEVQSDSKEFNFRLLELLAVACHQIAVHLYQFDDGIHKHTLYETWRDEPRDRTVPGSYRAPTSFSHNSYNNVEQYPNGVADCVGYWAEAKIFGGVVVFDRGESGTECKSLYLHGSLFGGPRTLYPPTTQQFQALLNLLLVGSDDDKSQSPLPIHASSLNRWRYHPDDAMSRFNIFRDRYERTVPATRSDRCVISGLDWPEIGDQNFLILQMYAKAEGEVVDEEAIAAAEERLYQITPSSPCWIPGWEYR